MPSKKFARPTPPSIRADTSAPNAGAAQAEVQASEAQAAERTEHLGTIVETMADGVAVYDVQGRPIHINRAYRELYALDRAPAEFEALTNLERARLLQLRDAVTGTSLPFEETPAGRALHGELVTGPSADIRARAFDGRELELNVSAAPLRDREGHLVGVVCVLHDQTERNCLAREREAAREASRRLEGFLAVAAHDLRTPLAAVVGFLDLAQRRTAQLVATARQESPAIARQVAAVRGNLEDASQGAERVARLLGRLFDTAAIRAGKLEMRRAPHDLAALVREQVVALRVLAPGRTIRLHTPAGHTAGSKPTQLILVEVDADRLGQVLTNYVTNALKYSPPDRPVEVAVEIRGGRARVAVCDQGPGIPHRSGRGCGSCSTRRLTFQRRVRRMAAAWGWGCTSAKPLLRPTVERSGSRAQWARAPPSGSPCRSPHSPHSPRSPRAGSDESERPNDQPH